MGKNRVVGHPTFGQLFKYFRIKSGFTTLVQLSDALENINIINCQSLYSRWQCDKRVPKDRELIIRIISLFINHGGIIDLYQANQLLKSAKKGFLTYVEMSRLPKLSNNTYSPAFEEFLTSEHPQVIKEIKKIRFNFTLESQTHKFFSEIASKNNMTKADFLRLLINNHLLLTRK